MANNRLTMKYMARLSLVTLLLATATAGWGFAQDEGDPGLSRAFGQGNGVRGTVTAAASDSFTIRTDEGDTYKVLYGPNTRLMKDRQPIEAGDIHVGDMLLAGGLVDAKAKTVGAVLVVDVDATEVEK